MENQLICPKTEQRLKFLVVDDEPLITEFIKTHLGTKGCQCDVALNGKEALELLNKNGPYTILITDIFMPEMDGLTLIKKAKEKWPELEIIAITAHGQKVKYRDVIEAGAGDFIRKPFEIDELEAKIARILREKELRDKLKLMVQQDPLTGIYNRRYFEEKLTEECYKAWRQKYPLHLVMFDIDKFKQFNDSFGHQAGDRLLKRLAEILVSSTRKYVDLPFRYGGDEFALILPQCDTDAACKIVKRIINRFSLEDFSPASLSAGIAKFIRREERPISEDVDDLILRADEALYEAKRKGGHIFVVDPLSKKDKKTRQKTITNGLERP
ncbi:GGDEF domain-containing response regulator [Thermodesulfatator atlanticus]|uniref:GGDEF domain-containing response regulator n=1 Tax=Thermodesulfatator atlanticus TaxID=501497 RepID=UPI0003B41DC8|nr:diguanylate cyclase [Thermodesulfatator atlanticus]